ncbi:MAG: MFS transporter [Ruminococcaceae bacterium]|nr:MFS transporter [Oscillospiraceae bacterium]
MISVIENKKYRLTKFACYMTNVGMAAVGAISPILFVTFKETYGISYTLLGFLVVINFCTQLAVDLIFTFFPSVFNIRKTIITMPLLTIIGLFIYSIMPALFPSSAYLWLSVGTVIFSASAGLCEVLISPVIAAIPSDNPERDMSKLHSTYAWGLVGVVIFGTVFLSLIGTQNWMWLPLTFSLFPISTFIMFLRSPIPKIYVNSEKQENGKLFGVGLLMCFFCIFLGGAAEGAMTQWISGYVEKALGISKIVGNILGMAMFAAALGLGRTLYSKCGKNILNFMIFGMSGSAVCYIIASLSGNAYVGLIACVLSGFCVSMLWPGNIILVGEKFPTAGVAAYALMAAGGDLGCSVAPQMVGAAADIISSSAFGTSLANTFNVTTEQIGMRSGLLIAGIFPLIGIILTVAMKSYFKKRKT